MTGALDMSYFLTMSIRDCSILSTFTETFLAYSKIPLDKFSHDEADIIWNGYTREQPPIKFGIRKIG